MNTVVKVFLSMSFSGGLLILTLLLGKRFLKNRLSRQWQYYIWLVVILRLLVPFGPEVSLLGKAYRAADQAIFQSVPLPQYPTQSPQNAPERVSAPPDSSGGVSAPSTAIHPLQDVVSLLAGHVWLVWLGAALGLLIRKITVYQSYIRYISMGATPVSDLALLDRLSVIAEQAGVRKPVELCVNPLVPSPLLIGFFHPVIVLPRADISEKDFRYTVLHELTHFKRLDIFYKWLAQITVCLHWFNPLVHLMSREITRVCEFSCDEAVLAQAGCAGARDYGNTLLDAMAAAGRCRKNPCAVTLSENKRLLKERLDAIMGYQVKSKTVKLLSVLLSLCIISGAFFIGTYSVSSAREAGSDIQAEIDDEHAHKEYRDEEFDEPEDRYDPDDITDPESFPDRSGSSEDGETPADGEAAPPENTPTARGRIWYPQMVPVDVESMADGEIIWLGEYTLSEGDRIWYAVSAETGNGLQVGFASPEDENLNTTYFSAENLRQKDETLNCVASFALRSPSRPGAYRLFLRATDGALENVKGSISIGFVADAVSY